MPDGSRQYRTAPTRSEAIVLLRAMLREVDQGRRASRSPTVAAFLREWLDEGTNVRPATYRRYRIIVERHLIPGLGTIRLRDLDALAIQRFLNHVGGAPRSVGHYRAVLRTALGWAQRMRLVVGNAAAEAHPPRVPEGDRDTLNARDALHLIEGTQDDWLHALWVLAVTTGMREAELLGLAWDDLTLTGAPLSQPYPSGAPQGLGGSDGHPTDQPRGVGGGPAHRRSTPVDSSPTLTIRQTLTRDKGQWVLAEPKTSRSRRTIVLSAVAAKALDEHRRKMTLARTPEWPYFGLVFTTQSGTPLYGWRVLQALYAAEERLGLPKVPVHGLRHSAASILIAQGYGLEDVKVLLGHASIGITSDTYSHPDLGRQQEVANGMDRALTR